MYGGKIFSTSNTSTFKTKLYKLRNKPRKIENEPLIIICKNLIIGFFFNLKENVMGRVWAEPSRSSPYHSSIICDLNNLVCFTT